MGGGGGDCLQFWSFGCKSCLESNRLILNNFNFQFKAILVLFPI